ncbi:MAG: LPS assembly protein LptD [Syntrophales bacterium]|jgi:LPS-assembly protein|nr:LPS assembly protein LptD [Syntrophales bacterium]MCK9390019.1 LPS assembly protein LptD [Syntrophales bacterium]
MITQDKQTKWALFKERLINLWKILTCFAMVLVFFTPAAIVFGDEITSCQGVVRDQQGNPLAGVFVELKNEPYTLIVTGPDGSFLLMDLPAEKPLSISIHKEGYFPVFETFSPRAGEKNVKVMVLSVLPPEPLQAEPVAAGAGQPQPVSIEADSLSYEQDTDTYHAEGDVIIRYAGNILTSDSADLNSKTDEAFAQGQVVLKSKQDVMAGSRMKMHMPSQTGVLEEGQVFIAETHFYIKGDRIEKRGETTYFVVNGQATTCDGEAPDWRLTGKTMNVTVDGYGTITHGKFYAGKAPVIYTPFFLFPAKTDRQSGFLFPNRMSFSSEKLGWDVGIPFYWAISKDTDATFYQRYMSERGFQEGAEFRFASESTTGVLYGDFLNDSKRITESVGNLSRDWQSNQQRWSFYWNQETRFDPTLNFRADVAKVSDNWYFKDFSSYNYFLANYSLDQVQPFKRVAFVGDEALPSLVSTLRLVKSWQLFNLTTLVQDTKDLTVASNDGTLQKYPEVTLTGAKAPLFGSPVNYEIASTYDYFYRGQGQKGQSLDINPTLSLPYNVGDYFQLTPFGGVQGTFWWRDDNIEDGLAKMGDREVYRAGANLTSEIHRVFQIGGKNLSRIRHSIQPEVTYMYVPHARQDSLPNYIGALTYVPNTLQTLQSGLPNYAVAVGEQNTVTYGLTNTLTARILDKAGNATYLEFLRFKLSQAYDIKAAAADTFPAGTERQTFSNIALELDFKPVTYFSFSARNQYSTYTMNWYQANYDMGVSDWRGDSANVIYRYTQNTGTIQNTQNGIEEVNLLLTAPVTKSFGLNFNLKRDLLNDRNIETTYGFTYKRQCWNIGFRYGVRNTIDTNGVVQPDDKIYEFQFAIAGL